MGRKIDRQTTWGGQGGFYTEPRSINPTAWSPWHCCGGSPPSLFATPRQLTTVGAAGFGLAVPNLPITNRVARLSARKSKSGRTGLRRDSGLPDAYTPSVFRPCAGMRSELEVARDVVVRERVRDQRDDSISAARLQATAQIRPDGRGELTFMAPRSAIVSGRPIDLESQRALEMRRYRVARDIREHTEPILLTFLVYSCCS